MSHADDLAHTDGVSRRMVAVYSEIYQPCYRFEPVAMEPAMRTVTRDIASLGWDRERLSRSSVFNVGTGREAVAFVDLGAGRVFHADLSEKPTVELAALACRDARYAAVSSRQLDLCRDQLTHVTAPIDLAYLNGVVHHLADPAAGLSRIVTLLAPGGTLFIRIYRSGSPYFVIVDTLRRFVEFDDRVALKKMWPELHRNRHADDVWLFPDLYDDLFVPVLSLYEPADLSAWLCTRFGLIPLEMTIDEVLPEMVELAFVADRLGPRQFASSLAFPRSIDQLALLAANPDTAPLATLFQNFVKRTRDHDRSDRLKAAVEVYLVARKCGGQRMAEVAEPIRRALRDAVPGAF